MTTVKSSDNLLIGTTTGKVPVSLFISKTTFLRNNKSFALQNLVLQIQANLGNRNMKGTTLCCRMTKSWLKTTATNAA